MRCEHIGITGTKVGGTRAQYDSLRMFLPALQGKVFHHGDCIGVDQYGARLAIEIGMRVVSHPPDNPTYRAFSDFDEERLAKPYGVRNHDIVDESDIMIAVPKSDKEELRSGTWLTVRYARKVRKTLYMIWPSGRISLYGGEMA